MQERSIYSKKTKYKEFLSETFILSPLCVLFGLILTGGGLGGLLDQQKGKIRLIPPFGVIFEVIMFVVFLVGISLIFYGFYLFVSSIVKWKRGKPIPSKKAVEDMPTKDLVEIYETVNSDDEKESILKELSSRRDELAIEPMISALKEKSWGLRDVAAKSLYTIGDKRAMQPKGVRS